MADAPRPRRRDRLERVRVELRLPPDTADRLYRWAAQHNDGISASAAELLEYALEHYRRTGIRSPE